MLSARLSGHCLYLDEVRVDRGHQAGGATWVNIFEELLRQFAPELKVEFNEEGDFLQARTPRRWDIVLLVCWVQSFERAPETLGEFLGSLPAHTVE